MARELEHHPVLNIRDRDAMLDVVHALDAPARLDVLDLLSRRPMISVGDIAEMLHMPMSTAALSVKILEEAGIVRTTQQPGIHGSTKLCHVHATRIGLEFVTEGIADEKQLVLKMPVGGYSSTTQITPTCGLASETEQIGHCDTPVSFYLPQHHSAQIVWFATGWLEYRFFLPENRAVNLVELSFESCSESFNYRIPWLSDLFVSMNGVKLGTWRSPADFGGRRGMYTPEWWDLNRTQYGLMKTWKVDSSGTWLDEIRIGDITVADLHLKDTPCLAVCIGVDPDGEFHGGMNIFGEKFGNYPQGIVLKYGFD